MEKIAKMAKESEEEKNSISKERKKCTKTQRERGQGGVFQAHDEKIHKFGQGSGVSEVQDIGGQTSSTEFKTTRLSTKKTKKTSKMNIEKTKKDNST